jgi:hypothetical protein
MNPDLDTLRWASYPDVLNIIPLYESHKASHYVLDIPKLNSTVRKLVSTVTRRPRVVDDLTALR